MNNSNRMDNKKDGVAANGWNDNIDNGVVGTDADDAGYVQHVDPVSGVRAGTPCPYKGPGDTSLTVGDPRYT